MSYTKEKYFDQITVTGMIDNRELDELTGVTLTIGSTSVMIDDFIEAPDGLQICCLINDNGTESYMIIPDAGLTFRNIIWKADHIAFPAYICNEA